MTIGYKAIMSVMTSHAQASGLFDSVNGHEPKSAPGRGLNCAMWAGPARPVQSSGLASVSVRIEIQVRIFLSANIEPGDRIDPLIIGAMDELMTAYIGNFNLDDNSRSIDIFGSDGDGLRAIPGYVLQDSKTYRIFDIFVPIIVNDVWQESP